jgi:signal transduction histidine kinase
MAQGRCHGLGLTRREEKLAALGGLLPLCSDDSGDIVKIAADLQLFPHSSRLSRHAG